MKNVKQPASRSNEDSGAVLILAMAFLVAVSLILVVLATLAGNDIRNSTNFRSARNLDYAASGAVNLAISNIRYTPLVGAGQTLNASPPSYCWGSSAPSVAPVMDGYQMAAWCSTTENLPSPQTRVVTIYSCASTVSAATCVTSPVLSAQVDFDDYPPQGGPTLTQTCSATCGEGSTLISWTWGTGAGGAVAVSAQANSITVGTPPSSGAVGGSTYTPLTSATSGDVVTTTSATTSTCTVTAGVVSFVGVGTCTLDYNDGGNGTYVAATQVVQSIPVTKGTAVLTTSSAPASATIGGPTYTVSGTSNTGDSITISASPSSICTYSPGTSLVTFIGSGNCVVTISDPGSVNYNAATVTQTIAVAGSGTYSGGSSGNLYNGSRYYQVNNGSSNSSSSSTANTITPGTSETLTNMRLTINSTSPSNHAATVGIVTGGVWTATALTCTITGGSNQTTCLITASVTIPVGSAINIYVTGNGNHSATWLLSYTQP